MSFREITSTFLYGEYAHRNRKYRDQLSVWKEHNDQFAMLKLNFTLAIRVIVECAIEIAEAIRNPDKATRPKANPDSVEGFPTKLQDRASIRLVTAGVIVNPKAIDSIKRRLQLIREINTFLFDLGRSDGHGFSSLNTQSKEIQHPEGMILGGDVGYRGASTKVNGVELDPDRAIQFAIGFLDDWRITVKVSSSMMPAEFINIDSGESFDEVMSTLEKHHGRIFDGWPPSPRELEVMSRKLM